MTTVPKSLKSASTRDIVTVRVKYMRLIIVSYLERTSLGNSDFEVRYIVNFINAASKWFGHLITCKATIYRRSKWQPSTSQSSLRVNFLVQYRLTCLCCSFESAARLEPGDNLPTFGEMLSIQRFTYHCRLVQDISSVCHETKSGRRFGNVK